MYCVCTTEPIRGYWDNVVGRLIVPVPGLPTYETEALAVGIARRMPDQEDPESWAEICVWEVGDGLFLRKVPIDWYGTDDDESAWTSPR